MQLRSIRVENVRSYVHAELDIPPGTTLLVGDVGAGKTSLLYAIEMALFGFAEVDPTFLVRHQATASEVALTLEDSAHTYELRRRFRRRVVRGRESFQLESSGYSEDGVTKTYSTTELRRRTIDLLGFPDNPNPRAHSDLWRWAVYIPQERMREILEQNPSDRLETVRKALGLEQYRLASENASIVAQELGRRADHRIAEAAGLQHFRDDLERWRTEAARAAEDRATAEANEASLRAAARSTEERVRQRELDVARAEGARSDLEATERRLAQVLGALDRLRARRVEIADLVSAREGALNRRPAVEQDLAQESSRLEMAKEEREVARRDVERSQNERAELESVRASVRGTADSLNAARRTLERERAALGDREAEVETALSAGPVREPPAPTPMNASEIAEALHDAQATAQELAGALAAAEVVERDLDEILREGRCPRCRQDVHATEFGAHRAEARKSVEEARGRLAAAVELRQRLDEERRARERFDRAHQNWELAEERRREARSRRDETLGRVTESDRRVQELHHTLADLESRVEALAAVAGRYAEAVARLARSERAVEAAATRRAELAAEIERLSAYSVEAGRLAAERSQTESEIAERSSELDEVSTRRAALAGAVAELPRLRDSLNAARGEHAESRLRLEQLHAQIGAAHRSEVHAAEQVERASAGAQRARELEAAAHQLRQLGSWLTHRFRDAMATLEQRVLTRAQSEFERSFARYFHALVDDPALVARCDGAFSPAVEINGEWTPAEALSGGERTALALAYRLALGHVVRAFGELSLETLILDEPTDGFSPEQVSRMGELLDELGLPQVLLVSHEGGLGAVADRVVRVRKEGGTSVLVAETGDSIPGFPALRPAPVPAGPRRNPRRRRIRIEDAATPTPSP